MASLTLTSPHVSSTSSSHSSVSISSLSPSPPSLPLLQSSIRCCYRRLCRRLSSSVIPLRSSDSISTSSSLFGLVHISTEDILKAEVLSGTEIGKKAKEFMKSGSLVSDEIVIADDYLVKMLKKMDGFLMDFPQSYAQAQSLEQLNVPDEILIDRCVGRRLDPVTGKVYHIKNILLNQMKLKKRQVTRRDDTEEKVIIVKIEANRPKEVVFEETQTLLSQLRLQKK